MAVGLWVYHIQSMHVPVFSLAHIKVFHTWPAARKVSYVPKIFAFLNFLPTFAFVQFNGMHILTPSQSFDVLNLAGRGDCSVGQLIAAYMQLIWEDVCGRMITNTNKYLFIIHWYICGCRISTTLHNKKIVPILLQSWVDLLSIVSAYATWQTHYWYLRTHSLTVTVFSSRSPPLESYKIRYL